MCGAASFTLVPGEDLIHKQPSSSRFSIVMLSPSTIKLERCVMDPPCMHCITRSLVGANIGYKQTLYT